METDNVFLSVGVVVAAVGMLMIAWHVRQRREHQQDAELSPTDRRFYDQQYRRRLQTSALTVTLGALLSLCENLPAFRQSPRFAAGYVLALLIAACWLILLALSDALASRVHLSQSMRRNRRARQELQDSVDQLRKLQAQQLASDEQDLLRVDRRKRSE